MSGAVGWHKRAALSCWRTPLLEGWGTVEVCRKSTESSVSHNFKNKVCLPYKL